jgi:hypothetical protein
MISVGVKLQYTSGCCVVGSAVYFATFDIQIRRTARTVLTDGIISHNAATMLSAL